MAKCIIWFIGSAPVGQHLLAVDIVGELGIVLHPLLVHIPQLQPSLLLNIQRDLAAKFRNISYRAITIRHRFCAHSRSQTHR